MGAEIIGASILGGASLFGTAATMATNDSNQDFSADQSEEARKWSTNERLAAQEYNTKERLATQEYNSVANQAMQYRAGGLNPNALGNAVSFHASNPQSSAPASAPMSGIGTAQVPNIPQLISSGADLVNALAKHSETKATLPLINEQVKNYMLQNFGQETTNKILDLEKQLKQATLPVEIKTKFEELAKLGFDKMVSEQQGKKFEQETKLLKQQEDINELLKGLKGQELIQAQYLTQRWNEIQDSVIALNKAKATEAKANASFTHEQTVMQSLENNIKKATNLYDIDNAIYNADVLQLLTQSETKERAWKQLQEAIWNSNFAKNAEQAAKIETALKRLANIVGLNTSVSVSAK